MKKDKDMNDLFEKTKGDISKFIDNFSLKARGNSITMIADKLVKTLPERLKYA